MTLQEFAKLKAGDKIVVLMNGSTGEVTDATKTGVRVRWGQSSQDFAYSVNSTAWFHWSFPEPAEDATG